MNNEIRKKEKRLNRQHWMCKIQKFVFNIDAPSYYMGYCPFFWMTVLAMALFLPIFIGRNIFAGLFWFNDWISEKLHDKKQKKLVNLLNVPIRPSDSDLLRLFNKEISIERILRYCSSRSQEKRMQLWFSQNPDWEKDIDKIRERVEQAKINKEKEREREQKRAQRMSSLVGCASIFGKIFFKGGAALAIVLIAALVYFAIYNVIVMTTLAGLVLVGTIIVGALFCFFAGRIVGDGIISYVEYRSENNLCFSDSLLGKFFTGIGHAVEFVKDLISLTYTKECPLILWGEETGPITKRNNE